MTEAVQPPLKLADVLATHAALVRQYESRANTTISPNDQMHQGRDDHYFTAGRSALANISRVMALREGAQRIGSWTCHAGTAGLCECSGRRCLLPILLPVIS